MLFLITAPVVPESIFQPFWGMRNISGASQKRFITAFLFFNIIVREMYVIIKLVELEVYTAVVMKSSIFYPENGCDMFLRTVG
jgi:hypothetical protein